MEYSLKYLPHLKVKQFLLHRSIFIEFPLLTNQCYAGGTTLEEGQLVIIYPIKKKNYSPLGREDQSHLSAQAFNGQLFDARQCAK